jgi:hypothetical protein
VGRVRPRETHQASPGNDKENLVTAFYNLTFPNLNYPNLI